MIHKSTKTKPNRTIRALRNIIDRKQAEFAAMIGTSRDAVASWECGRNRLSHKFALRIQCATGANANALLRGTDAPSFNVGGRPYSKSDFDYWRKRVSRSEVDVAKEHARLGAGSLEVLLLAAAKPGNAKIKDRLPGVWQSFLHWIDQTQVEFALGGQIQEVLAQRKFKDRLTMTWGDWRGSGAEYGKYYGFKDNKRKPDDEDLTLEVEAHPCWVPGSDMTARDDARTIKMEQQKPSPKRRS